MVKNGIPRQMFVKMTAAMAKLGSLSQAMGTRSSPTRLRMSLIGP